MYHSESGQDQWLEENVFRGLRGGVFFEAGALDGVLHSNSLFFERERGWSGVLVEANPSMTPLIAANRPDATAFSCALGPYCDGDVTFKAVSGPLFGWSGVVDAMDHRHVQAIEDHIPPEWQRVVKVPCRRLESILDETGITHVDYMSLDLEGAELDVLSVFPFERFHIDVLAVEDNYGCPELAELLTKNNYHHLARVGVDEIWRFAGIQGE